MVRRTDPTPTDAAPGPAGPPAPAEAREGGPGVPDLSSFPVVGLTRRRMAAILGAALAIWIVIVFARQVSDAAAASRRAEAMVVANAQRRDEIAGLERELDQVGQRRYIVQQARGYGLGESREIAFTLDPAASPLPSDAPGSAGVRLGAPAAVSPLERWLTLLFGPGD